MTTRAPFSDAFAASAAVGARVTAQAWLWWRSDSDAAARPVRW
jgi:hypothetical protein